MRGDAALPDVGINSTLVSRPLLFRLQRQVIRMCHRRRSDPVNLLRRLALRSSTGFRLEVLCASHPCTEEVAAKRRRLGM